MLLVNIGRLLYISILKQISGSLPSYLWITRGFQLARIFLYFGLPTYNIQITDVVRFPVGPQDNLDFHVLVRIHIIASIICIIRTSESSSPKFKMFYQDYIMFFLTFYSFSTEQILYRTNNTDNLLISTHLSDGQFSPFLASSFIFSSI